MNQTFYLEDESATVSFGSRLSGALQMCNAAPADAAAKQGCVIFLQGDLGAGKTTLTRGILLGYGHQGAVKSPTYTLVEPYDFERGAVFHFDLYRLGDPEELEYMGIRDYFEAGNLCLIEWPKRGEGCLPEPDLILHLEVSLPGRKVRLEALNDFGQKVLQQVTKIQQNTTI